MASSFSYISQPPKHEHILNEFQAITGLNIDDAIHFLDLYNWKLDNTINDYYDGIKLKHNSDKNSSLGTFYSNDDCTQQQNVDSDRHYAELLHLYGDADEWTRQQQQQQQQQQQKQHKSSQEFIKDTPIYHEKQRLMKCGLHSLNNLFQIPKLFTSHHLEMIVRDFDKRKFFNDYRTLWLGNYDLRILIEAINRCGFNVRQLNIYHGESIYHLPWDSYFGLLINLNGTHWFTIKNHNGIYHNLDSTLRKPIQIGGKERLIQYLINLIQKTRTVYLFVVSQQMNGKEKFLF
ncbi:unnamed protein product [Rotaria magnacalcarata]|uniref:ubiquitinyl hydrolase 1 n=1 Tax=Rotaria magnacalcarata TaxID=392030 RepID=A0A815R7A9_9BILA|nr:unnamed protein product [Rotaria magnacalcarata]CAF1472858.1 unnamed protein product [Rotaria magnacalcarata]CAF4070779.1 unnamed protein product [Rotaria magnacalcarata]CAF4746052.1 unnamed protein product [Rotaria magnacalcarata]